MAISLTPKQAAALKAQPASQQEAFRRATNAQQTQLMNGYVILYDRANPPKEAAKIEYTDVVSYNPQTGATTTKQYQTTNPQAAGYVKPADLAFYQKQAADSQAIYQRNVAEQQRQAQMAVEQQQAREAAAAKAQADAVAKQQAIESAAQAKQQQLDAAQAAFRLPEIPQYAGTFTTGVQKLNAQTQEITDPKGNTYLGVPADPKTGAPAQWYRVQGNAQTGYTEYQPVSQNLQPAAQQGPIAPDQLNVYDRVRNVDQYNQQQYIASVPTTDVTTYQKKYNADTGGIEAPNGVFSSSTRNYQTQDKTLSNYISPVDLAALQKNAQATKQELDTAVANFKPASPRDLNLKNFEDLSYLQANNWLKENTAKPIMSPDGTVYQPVIDQNKQTGYRQSTNPTAPGFENAQVLQQQQQQYYTRAENMPQILDRYENNINKYESYTQGLKNPDNTISDAKAKPLIDEWSGAVYYPTASGWQQSQDPTAAGYMPAEQIKMFMPEPASYKRGVVPDTQKILGPGESEYYPVYENKYTGTKPGWIQSTNSKVAGYVEPDQFSQFVNYQNAAAAPGTIKKNPLSNAEVQLTNPWEGNYQEPRAFQADVNNYIAQERARQAAANKKGGFLKEAFSPITNFLGGIANALGIDDELADLDKFINKTVGWDNIASIGGGMLGGPLGSAVAKGVAQAEQGKELGEILQGAAISYALAYGTKALMDNIGSAMNTTIDQSLSTGIVDQGVFDEAAQEFADNIVDQSIVDYLPDTVKDFVGPPSDLANFVPGITDDFVDDFADNLIDAVAPDIVPDFTDDIIDAVIPESISPPDGVGDFVLEPVAPLEPTPIIGGEETFPPGMFDDQVEYDIPGTDATTSVQPIAPTATMPGSTNISTSTDIASTGISDMPAGTIFEGPTGTEVVLDSGKTVNLVDYNTAIESGQPVSVDGQITTGGTVTVGPAPAEFDNLLPIEPTYADVPNIDISGVGSTGEAVLPDVIVNGTIPGLTTAQIAALGGLTAAAAVVASSGIGGAAAAADSVLAATPSPGPSPVPQPPTPVEPVPQPPTTPTPVEPVPQPPTTPTPVEPVPQPPTPVEPVPQPPTPVEPVPQPPAPVEPVPVEPPVTQPPVVEPVPVEPPVVEPPIVEPPVVEPPIVEPPVPVEPPPVVEPPVQPPPTEVPVYDYSTPYTGEYSNQSVLERFMSGTITYGDVAKLVAAGYVLPSVLALIGGAPPAAPGRRGYGPLAPIQWGTLEGGLTNPGLNPGFLTFGGSPPPAYQTTNPLQSQYYWGLQPYMQTQADLANYNQVQMPAVPFGQQQPRGAFDTQKFIRETIGTPEYQQAAMGASTQYPGGVAPATSYQGGVVAPAPMMPTPQFTTPVPTAQPMNTMAPQFNMPVAPAIPQVNMNFTPVTVPDTLPEWAPGMYDINQPVAPYGTTPVPVKA